MDMEYCLLGIYVSRALDVRGYDSETVERFTCGKDSLRVTDGRITSTSQIGLGSQELQTLKGQKARGVAQFGVWSGNS